MTTFEGNYPVDTPTELRQGWIVALLGAGDELPSETVPDPRDVVVKEATEAGLHFRKLDDFGSLGDFVLGLLGGNPETPVHFKPWSEIDRVYVY